MKFKLWIGILFMHSAFSEITSEDDVWVLTDSNFQEALDKQPDLLVEFYAPWCGHCKKLAPEYSKAAKKLLNNNPPIHIAKVDATANPKFAAAHKVEGYPTLKYFVSKVANEYTGGRTEDTIVSWVLKRNTPSLSVFASLSEFQSFAASHKILALLLAEKDSSEAKVFETVSKAIDSVTFVLVSDPEALNFYSVTKGAVVLLKQYDDKRVDFKGRLTQNDLTKFVNDNRLPWVIPFGDDAIDAIFKKQAPALFLFTNDYSAIQKEAELLSQEFKGVLVFSYADLEIPDNGRLAEYLGVKPKDQPISVIVDPRGDFKKYKLEEKVSEASLRKFANDWRGRKLEAYLKSDPVPEKAFDGNVRVLVGHNFDSVVLDQTKDVLVEFYAPWCGHCKSLAPDYEKLAAEFKENENVVIAKMDSTTNEAKGVSIKGFPTIKFYPAGNKKPVDFDGERNFEGLLSFVKANAKAKAGETLGKVEL